MVQKGSFEALEWVDNHTYKMHQPSFLRKISDFQTYRLICSTCNEDQLYELHTNYIKKMGFSKGIQSFINHLRSDRTTQRREKQAYMDKQIKEAKIKLEQLENQIKEEDKLSNMSDEEKEKYALREREWTGPHQLPLETILQQPVIEEFSDNEGCGYKVFDKIYKTYVVIVWSPLRKQPNGIQGVIRIDCTDELAAKRNAGNEYYAERDLYRKTIAKEQRTQQKKQKDIERIREAMGLNTPQTDPSVTRDLEDDSNIF